jgi:RND family efflux transporter MFP subunit
MLSLGLSAALGCSRNGESDVPAVPTVLVDPAHVVLVESRRLESGVSFTGELVPLEVVEVSARFEGDLEAVLVRAGQRVRRGQPLARYGRRELHETWEAAQAGVQSAQADLAAADNAVRRAKRLLEAGAASPAQLETAETQRTAAEARLRAARAALGSAEENTAKLDVPSPIDGSVSSVLAHSGDRTAVGDKLMTLVDTRHHGAFWHGA